MVNIITIIAALNSSAGSVPSIAATPLSLPLHNMLEKTLLLKKTTSDPTLTNHIAAKCLSRYIKTNNSVPIRYNITFGWPCFLLFFNPMAFPKDSSAREHFITNNRTE